MKKTADSGMDVWSKSRQVLQSGLNELGYGQGAQALLMRYLSEMAHWNKAYNLTAIRDPVEMVVRHLLDSIAAMVPVAALRLERVLDVGSGAGLPGIPLAILHPECAVTVLDSNGKKANFLRHVVRTLSLSNVEVVHGRIESYQPARKFDGVTSRAFADLEKFVTVTRHVLHCPGYWLAMTGRVDNNARMSPPARENSDVAVQRIRLEVPGLAETRHLVIIPFGGAMNS